MTFNEKILHFGGNLLEKRNLIYTQKESISTINLNKKVVLNNVELEQVSKSKIYTSKAKDNNESLIGQNNLFGLGLLFMSTEKNTLSINLSDNISSSYITSSQPTGQKQV